MRMNEVRRKLIRDTVVNTILVDTKKQLLKNIPDYSKIDALLAVTHIKLNSILDSMGKNSLLPNGEIQTESELEAHILNIIGDVKAKLNNQLEKDVQ